MGDDSSDLACAGKVSAVGSVALTKALYRGAVCSKMLSLLQSTFGQWDRTEAGGAGKGRKRGRTTCETAARGTPGVPGGFLSRGPCGHDYCMLSHLHVLLERHDECATGRGTPALCTRTGVLGDNNSLSVTQLKATLLFKTARSLS